MKRERIAFRRTATALFVALAGALSFGLYVVKHRVIELEGRLTEINRNIARDQQAIHVLRAEWSYLNEPARLGDLARRHLGMTPASGGQFGTLLALPAADLRASRREARDQIIPASPAGEQSRTAPEEEKP